MKLEDANICREVGSLVAAFKSRNAWWLACLFLCWSLPKYTWGASFEKDECFAGGFGYEQRDHQIYFWVATDMPSIDQDEGVVKDALYDSFLPLKSTNKLNLACFQLYGKDAAHVFYRGHIIEGVDLATFETMDSDLSLYAKDKGAIYFAGKRISTRVQQFRRLGHSWYATDGEQAFYYGKLIGTGNLDLVPGDDEMARTESQLFLNGKLVQGANPSGYSRRSQGCLSQYGVDSEHVFIDNKPLSVADTETFEELGTCSTIYRDKRMVYMWNQELPDVDRDSARVFGSAYLVDKLAVYSIRPHIFHNVGGIKRMANRDAASFQDLDGAWTKDKNGVYYLDKKVPKADPVTFKMETGAVYRDGIDKNYRYVDGRISCKFGKKGSDNIPHCDW